MNQLKKRILILNWRDNKHPGAGGAEAYNHGLARAWVEAGHQVTVFCSHSRHLARHETIDGVNIIRRGRFGTVYLWAAIYYLRHARGRYDLLIDCQNGVPFYSPLYARIPVVCVVHHVHQRVFNRYLPTFQAAFAKWLEHTAMPLVYRRHQYVAVSPSTKTAMVSELGIPEERITVVYNGLDHRLNRPGPKSADPTIIYVGRLKSYKSVDTLLQAFALIKSEFETAQVIIVGTGDDTKRLKRLTAQLGLTANVKFKGHVTDNRRVDLMQSAWVAVNPSYAEGWGVTTIEAYACGTPVVASDIEGLRDSVHAPHAGRLFAYGDSLALAEALRELLSDQGLRSKLTSAAIRWARRFDWRLSARQLLEIASLNDR